MFSLFKKIIGQSAKAKQSKIPYTENMRLNLGCGLDYREGYVNVDMHGVMHKVDLQADVAWLKEIADQSCVEILAQDVLEHIPRPRGINTLREWNRVLRMGGRLTVRVPSLRDLLTLLAAPDRQEVAMQKQLIQCLYGTQSYEGDYHLNGFTEVTLRHDLEQAGFEMRELRLIDEWLFDVDACKIRHVAPDELLHIESDEAFLRAAYLRFLGREPDEKGAQWHLSLLRSRGIHRETVLADLAASEEHRAFMEKSRSTVESTN